MTDDPIDGPRLGELFLAEIIGRSLGGLGTLSVDGLDHPARFTCAVGETYELVRDEEVLGRVFIETESARLEFDDGDVPITIDTGGAVKSAVDALCRRVPDQ